MPDVDPDQPAAGAPFPDDLSGHFWARRSHRPDIDRWRFEVLDYHNNVLLSGLAHSERQAAALVRAWDQIVVQSGVDEDPTLEWPEEPPAAAQPGPFNLHDDRLGQDVGYRLLMNTPVTLYWRQEVLGRALTWLLDHGYQVVEWDTSAWPAETDMLRGVGEALHFPDYYGRNLDALNDCMRDVVTGAYGWDPDSTGLVLVLRRYDAFTVLHPQRAQALLDIFADHSRSAALFGRRLIVLVQSDDPRIRYEPVGATPVMWNDAEWLDSHRQPE